MASSKNTSAPYIPSMILRGALPGRKPGTLILRAHLLICLFNGGLKLRRARLRWSARPDFFPLFRSFSHSCLFTPPFITGRTCRCAEIGILPDNSSENASTFFTLFTNFFRIKAQIVRGDQGKVRLPPRSLHPPADGRARGDARSSTAPPGSAPAASRISGHS